MLNWCTAAQWNWKQRMLRFVFQIRTLCYVLNLSSKTLLEGRGGVKFFSFWKSFDYIFTIWLLGNKPKIHSATFQNIRFFVSPHMCTYMYVVYIGHIFEIFVLCTRACAHTVSKEIFLEEHALFATQWRHSNGSSLFCPLYQILCSLAAA